MAVSYPAPTHGTTVFQSQALATYKNLHENLLNEGVNILNENGLTDVFHNAPTFAQVSEELVSAMTESDADAMRTMLENNRREILTESMVSGTNAITALSLPMLRVGWPKIAVREGLPTEAVESPKFKVTTKRPYVLGSKGEKLFLPAALADESGFEFSLPKLKSDPITATKGMITSYDLLTPISKNKVSGDEIDPQFRVIKVKVDIGGEEKDHVVDFQLDTNNNTITGVVTNAAGNKSATIVGTVDRANGLLNLTAIGGELKEAVIEGYVSSEANNSATQIGMDITAEDCVIGTAQPVESPINIQHMTDMMAMYQLDATLANIETMSTFLAHTTDKEGVRFIDDTYERKSQKINETFDAKAPNNYALGEVAWREELKAKLDRLVSRIQMATNIYNGRTVIFCNPLDAQLVNNVKWIYSGVEQVNDVVIDYKVGQYVSGVTTYTVLQSPHFSKGKLRVVFVPSDEDNKGLTYYPYSFTTVRGTASSSSNAVNVPSIQMIKRHLFKSFTPLVGMLVIQNN